MLAQELISKTLIPLRTSDTGADAIVMMNDHYVKHLPIVNDKQLLGILSETDILNNDMSEPVGSYDLLLSQKTYTYTDDHLFEVMGLMAQHTLSVIPVVDHQQDYIGLITQEELIQYYARSFSFEEPGSILVLEMAKHDYSLAHLSQIIEQENAAILSVFISHAHEIGQLWVTLKVNKLDSQAIVAALMRYDYKIKATFQEEEFVDALQERYDLLMNYLGV